MLPSALPAIEAVTDEPLPDVVIPALGFVICQSRVTLTVQDAGIGFENVDCILPLTVPALLLRTHLWSHQ